MCKACEQKMTVEQVLQITAANLQGIMIPVEMSETVGATISGSIRNLRLCLDAMAQERMQKEAAEQERLQQEAAAAAAAAGAEAPAVGEAWEVETDE